MRSGCNRLTYADFVAFFDAEAGPVAEKQDDCRSHLKLPEFFSLLEDSFHLCRDLQSRSVGSIEPDRFDTRDQHGANQDFRHGTVAGTKSTDEAFVAGK